MEMAGVVGGGHCRLAMKVDAAPSPLQGVSASKMRKKRSTYMSPNELEVKNPKVAFTNRGAYHIWVCRPNFGARTPTPNRPGSE